MSDRLSNLLQRFELSARVYHTGALCGIANFDGRDGVGHLHLVRQGPIEVTDRNGIRQVVSVPSALFYPRPLAHQLHADERAGADVVCAAIEFGLGDENPLLRGLPDLLIIVLADMPSLDSTLQLLFSEAIAQRCGHDAVVGRLTEVLVVQMLRFAIERQLVDSGLLAGLSDTRLAKALTAMHADPSRAWTLEALADSAGMSRARFAARFAEVVGIPPGEYLMQWRIGLAKALLRRGRPVKQVALEVGYGGASALGRAFSHLVGMAPTQWLEQQHQ
ncbi:AraC family transcriptional regulator [Variovorax sp. LjRoot84]|uniref:AraC family transcriptional regulator n=1 Tax=Variovorax sp. LjRoot84 TaxID=3342340 RepID=UPI003ECF50BB